MKVDEYPSARIEKKTVNTPAPSNAQTLWCVEVRSENEKQEMRKPTYQKNALPPSVFGVKSPRPIVEKLIQQTVSKRR